jgi:6-phosphogluconolactonase (cycloisomerase 2 family)
MKKAILIMVLMISAVFGTDAQNDKSYIPRDLEEAVLALDKLISEEGKYELCKMGEDEFLAATHLGIGMYLRNEWGLWKNSELRKYFRRRGIFHPDDMSGEILKSYYKFLCQRPWNDIDLVIGTYGEHLYIYNLDCQTLEFTMKAQAEAKNPSYALAETGQIFAVSEVGEVSGAYSFQVNAAEDGGMTLQMTADRRQTGADPCFVMHYVETYLGAYLMTADYSGGSVSVFPIRNGQIGERVELICFEGRGPVSARQEASHIHQLKKVPGAQGYILASDLGADVIRLLKVGKCEGTAANPGALKLEHIKDIPCPAGSGPRHMEFSADGKRLYCIAELSGEVLVYGAGSDGEPSFTLVQRIQADEMNAGGSADIHIHPSGKWIYTSHRLDNDGISIFNINEDGTLEKCGYARTGRHPRNFMITPDGELLLVACRDDRLIQVFTIEKDGTLTLTPSKLVFESDMPSSITAVL